jgi:hypothetical protein
MECNNLSCTALIELMRNLHLAGQKYQDRDSGEMYEPIAVLILRLAAEKSASANDENGFKLLQAIQAITKENASDIDLSDAPNAKMSLMRILLSNIASYDAAQGSSASQQKNNLLFDVVLSAAANRTSVFAPSDNPRYYLAQRGHFAVLKTFFELDCASGFQLDERLFTGAVISGIRMAKGSLMGESESDCANQEGFDYLLRSRLISPGSLHNGKSLLDVFFAEKMTKMYERTMSVNIENKTLDLVKQHELEHGPTLAVAPKVNRHL